MANDTERGPHSIIHPYTREEAKGIGIDDEKRCQRVDLPLGGIGLDQSQSSINAGLFTIIKPELKELGILDLVENATG